jgi:hypothetical protein
MTASIAKVTVTVVSQTGDLVADDWASTSQNSPVVIPVMANDRIAGNPATPSNSVVVITSPPTQGTVTVNPDGTVTYTPNEGACGQDTFQYTLTRL